MSQKKLILYQDSVAEIGGVETALVNDAIALSPYYEVLVLYGNDKSGGRRMMEIDKYCDVERYDDKKQYECDILIRNSVFWRIPENIKAKKIYEILHADYEWLYSTKTKFTEWSKAEKIGCGEYVAKQYHKMHPEMSEVKWIRNILAPKKKTHHILRLITASRLSPEKGWDRMKKLAIMLKNAGIKFRWDIFTNSKITEDVPEEMHFWKSKFDGIIDYIAEADYLVQLSDTEGLPYSVQEALQYNTACVVTNIGGMTELIQDGVNGYVVPLDMQFDINKLLNVPSFQEYTGTNIHEWLELLGNAEYKKKKRIQYNVKVKAKMRYKDLQIYNEKTGESFTWIDEGKEYIVNRVRANELESKGIVTIIENVK